MSNLYKITSLFITAVIIFINSAKEYYPVLLNSIPQNGRNETINSFCSIEVPNLFLLNRHGEKSLTSLGQLPVSNLKNQSTDFYCSYLNSEILKSGINSKYLSYSETIYRNLTNSDIIFPFNYFW